MTQTSSNKNGSESANKTLDPQFKQTLSTIANTIRVLSMDAVQKADSGHPGLPMGCAEIGAYLWGYALRYNPKDPHWIDRDRFILSAGHGSMLLYSCLHLSGYDLSLDDIKHFRQLHSKTPGHPESIETLGVETTTGPLGQGFGNAVGTALGLKLLEAKFNKEKQNILDGKVYCLVGDGCIMEGISSEVSSLAGHLKLDNLIVIYDSNHICLDGPLVESCTEDTTMRYKAYGWDVIVVEDGNSLDQIHEAVQKAKTNQQRPVIIIAHTIIGKGAPNKAGTHKAHGAPLGPEEIKATKIALGVSDEPFFVPESVKKFFSKKLPKDIELQKKWQENFDKWAKDNAQLAKEFQLMKDKPLPADIEEKLWAIAIKAPVAGRKASNDVINVLADMLPYLYGGSADLSGSDLTMMKNYPLVAPGVFSGRNIKYGVREFGMAAAATGMAQTQLILPFIGTFLTFSDYMRNAIRLCSLMKEHVIYQFTHDSIFLGEDGPTHQPIEHYATLRAIPNLHVIRPADSNEVKMAWLAALRYKGPTALILSRQNLPDFAETKRPYSEGLGKGAYIAVKEKGKPDFTLIATGSEFALAMDVSKELEKKGKNVRVVSMPCWELFDEQSEDYRKTVLGGDLGQRVSIEAGVAQGWHKYIGIEGIPISIERFGASAPIKDLQKEYGFTVEAVMKKLLP